jgi:DNA-binding transcriptional ArsR family regulator
MGPRSHNWLDAVAEPTRLYILRCLLDVPEATVTDLVVGCSSAQTLRRHLEALVSTGLIHERPGESDGETAGRPAARFMLVPEVREGLASVLSTSP